MNSYNTDYLEHHGILGQKWGVRRYQNQDGSLTAAGRKRQQKEFAKRVVKGQHYKHPNYDFKLKDDIREAANPEKLEKLQKAHDKYAQTLDGRYYTKEKNYDTWHNFTKVRDEMVNDIVGKYGSKKIRYIQSRYNTTVEDLMRVYANGIPAEYSEEEYQKKRDSFKTDEEKDRWQAKVERTGKL